MSDQALAAETVGPVDLIVEYVKLRDGKKNAEDMFKTWLAENFKDRMTVIEATLLEKMRELGVQSLKGPAGTGTVYQKLTSSATLADAAEFRRHVIGSEEWDLTEWRVNKTAVEEMLGRGEQLPPGINYTQFMTVGIRKS